MTTRNQKRETINLFPDQEPGTTNQEPVECLGMTFLDDTGVDVRKLWQRVPIGRAVHYGWL